MTARGGWPRRVAQQKKMDSQLYETAKDMETSGMWRGFLTEEEHAIFSEFLWDKDKWLRFINLEEDLSTGTNFTREVLQMVAIRTRAMLFEPRISAIFSTPSSVLSPSPSFGDLQRGDSGFV